jgi:phosphoribosylformimino-5-aminoimidazole carboxamide ribotide isomerase
MRTGTDCWFYSTPQRLQDLHWPDKPLNPELGGCRSAVVDLFPAIDIRSGRVVRLSQGETARQTIYGEDPVVVAEDFTDQGASWIHVVDLDKAFSTGDNADIVARLARRVGPRVRLQLGGGFRTLDLVRAGLGLGVDRVVIGTAAAVNPSFVGAAVSAFGSQRLVVGIDSRGGNVAVRGWTETSSTRAEHLAQSVVADGIETVIYTDIARDGMLSGPDLPGAAALLATGARVIVSGGVAQVEDIVEARRQGLAGAVVGRALYEGRFTLADALAACHAAVP